MIKLVTTDDFLTLRKKYTLIDVRSPGEYNKAHIPGAINIPLFSDEERADVGTRYKQVSKENAMIVGLEYAAKNSMEYLEKATLAAEGKPVLVYCWRGGNRSNAFCHLLQAAKIDSFRLEGGYKAYKKFIRAEFNKEIKIIILGGMTGSGKTEKLLKLKEMGQQVIDLEGIAIHKGSAFGYSPTLPQPSNEHFENLLYEEWRKLDFSKPLWLEDESRMIGRCQINDYLFNRMRSAVVIKIVVQLIDRVKRLVEDYTGYDKLYLIESFERIAKRLGGENYKNAIMALENDDFATAAEIALKYYDKAYEFGLSKRNSNKIIELELSSDLAGIAAIEIIECARKNRLF